MEEREILGQQLVHRLDMERLDAGDFRPCDERLGPPPHDLAREPQGRERQHIRREHANRERVVARDRAEQLGHDERRRVEDEHVANARQEEGRHRNRRTPCDLPAVTTQHEPERLVQASGVTSIGGGRHYSVLKAKGPSPQPVMALAKSVRARLATSPGNTWARMAAGGRRDRKHPRAGEGHSKQADHRPAGESMTRRLILNRGLHVGRREAGWRRSRQPWRHYQQFSNAFTPAAARATPRGSDPRCPRAHP